MKKSLNIALPVVVCLLTGWVASLLQNDALMVWYPSLVKSTLTPPNAVFPIAWGILYILMGVSIGLILNRANKRERRFFTALFDVQLLFNFLWSIAFFVLESPLLGLIDIVILDGLVVFYIIRSWRTFRTASLLFVPYAAWIIFATYLNFFILIHN